jgi:hypothetical protein
MADDEDDAAGGGQVRGRGGEPVVDSAVRIGPDRPNVGGVARLRYTVAMDRSQWPRTWPSISERSSGTGWAQMSSW